jgi:hypothetical protein
LALDLKMQLRFAAVGVDALEDNVVERIAE